MPFVYRAVPIADVHQLLCVSWKESREMKRARIELNEKSLPVNSELANA